MTTTTMHPTSESEIRTLTAAIPSVTSKSPGTIEVMDLYNLENALPPRFRPRSYHASGDIVLIFGDFGTYWVMSSERRTVYQQISGTDPGEFVPNAFRMLVIQ